MEPLASAAPALGVSLNVEIPVEAGDTLGYVANTPLDLAVNDSAAPAATLHPEFYGPNPFAVPLEDYYREPLRSQLLDWTLRELPPRTGHYGYDVAGTLPGLWYLEGSDPREFRFDHVVHFGCHHLQAHRSVFADGMALFQNESGPPLIEMTFWIRDNPRVESITPASGMVKLEMFSVQFVTVGSPPNERLNDISGFDAEKETVAVGAWRLGRRRAGVHRKRPHLRVESARVESARVAFGWRRMLLPERPPPRRTTAARRVPRSYPIRRVSSSPSVLPFIVAGTPSSIHTGAGAPTR